MAVLAYFVIVGLTEGMWVARIPAVKAGLHLTYGLLGTSLLVGPAALVAVMPVAGRLADRIGSAPLSRYAGMAVAVLPLFLWTAGTLVAVLLALLAFGVAGGTLIVGLNSQGVRVEQGYGRPLMASFHASYSVGGLAGALLGGLLAWHQAGPAGPTQESVLAGIALGGVTVTVIAGRRLLSEPAGSGGWWLARCRPGQRPVVARLALQRARAPRGGWPAPRRRGLARLTALGLLALCCVISDGAAANWSGVYLRYNLGAPRGLAMAGFAGFSLAMAAGRMVGDRLADRYGPVCLVRGCGLLASAGLAAALCTHSPVAAVIGFAACGGGLSCTVPQFLSAAGHADPDRPAGGIARVSGLGYFGLVGGPALIGGCASLAGLAAALSIPVALGLCVAFFSYLLDPSRSGLAPARPVLDPPVPAVAAPVSGTDPARPA